MPIANYYSVKTGATCPGSPAQLAFQWRPEGEGRQKVIFENASKNQLNQIEERAQSEMNVVQVPANGGGGRGWSWVRGGENQRLGLIQLGSKALQAVTTNPGFSSYLFA